MSIERGSQSLTYVGLENERNEGSIYRRGITFNKVVSSSIEYHIFMSKICPPSLYSTRLTSLLEGLGFVSSIVLSLALATHIHFLLEEICFLFFFWQVSSYINAQNLVSLRLVWTCSPSRRCF